MLNYKKCYFDIFIVSLNDEQFEYFINKYFDNYLFDIFN